ncbi:immunogenic protein MPT64 [Mycobacterium xenopi 3993]|nr:immunogenic protein MPT64 [Mycobacterium xenopi 3993]
MYQNVGANPKTTWKAFNWDQTYRKAITYTAASDDKEHTPLWRVDDPLKTVAPIVQAELQKQQAPPPPPAQPGQPAAATPTTQTPPLPIAPGALYNPDNYQNFAVVNDGCTSSSTRARCCPTQPGRCRCLCPGRRSTRCSHKNPCRPLLPDAHRINAVGYRDAEKAFGTTGYLSAAPSFASSAKAALSRRVAEARCSPSRVTAAPLIGSALGTRLSIRAMRGPGSRIGESMWLTL